MNVAMASQRSNAGRINRAAADDEGESSKLLCQRVRRATSLQRSKMRTSLAPVEPMGVLRGPWSHRDGCKGAWAARMPVESTRRRNSAPARPWGASQSLRKPTTAGHKGDKLANAARLKGWGQTSNSVATCASKVRHATQMDTTSCDADDACGGETWRRSRRIQDMARDR